MDIPPALQGPKALCGPGCDRVLLHGRDDLLRHHQVRPVADEHIHITVGRGHLDAKTGGDLVPVEIKQPIELGDRKDLLDDFLTTVRLKKTDVKVDQLVELEPERRGKERLIAGGTVIGVLTEQFAVAADRLATQGKGDSQSVADNAKPEGRAMNRRVEFAKL